MEEEKIQDQRVALMNAIFAESMKGYSLQPKLGKSRKFKFRDAMVDMRICKYCWKEYGRVFPAESAPSTSEIRRESHWFCRCHIEWMRSILGRYGDGQWGQRRGLCGKTDRIFTGQLHS